MEGKVLTGIELTVSTIFLQMTSNVLYEFDFEEKKERKKKVPRTYLSVSTAHLFSLEMQ